jgi:hypothetical protein
MKAIPTAELCITCHGSNLDPAIAATLAEFYPADRATRFAVGDIRGAFTIEQPMSWGTRIRGTKAHSRAAENLLSSKARPSPRRARATCSTSGGAGAWRGRPAGSGGRCGERHRHALRVRRRRKGSQVEARARRTLRARA